MTETQTGAPTEAQFLEACFQAVDQFIEETPANALPKQHSFDSLPILFAFDPETLSKVRVLAQIEQHTREKIGVGSDPVRTTSDGTIETRVFRTKKPGVILVERWHTEDNVRNIAELHKVPPENLESYLDTIAI